MKRLSSNMLIALILLCYACDDVLEEDISDESITIIAPLDGTALEGNVVQFRWGAIDGADDYRVQLMIANQFIVLDSLVQGTLYNYQIEPGEYTWRVRGENFAYVSPYSFESTFSIAASLDLTNQVITLGTPENNTYLNNVASNFSWQAISTAETYEFEILEVVGTTEISVFKDDDLLSSTITVPAGIITKDAEYIWQVKANNSTSSTKFYRRKFFVDSENPPVPILSTPTTDQIFSTTVQVDFTWVFNDTGDVQSAITSTIEISADENFSTIALSDTNTNNEFSNSFSTANTYYWRVRGADAAGNQGENSATGSFVVN